MEEAKLQEICDAGLAPPAHHAYFDDPPLAASLQLLNPARDGRTAALPSPSRDTLTAPHP
jgi:hypothetical protein